MTKNKKIIWLTGQPGSGKTTLAEAIHKKISEKYSKEKIIIVDGDDLRNITTNKDYSRKGRENNIITAQKIAHFLSNKNFIVIVALVAPYLNIREDFKSVTPVSEIYLHTNEVRGREHFFADDYEKPEKDFLEIDTTNKKVEECVNEILSFYW